MEPVTLYDEQCPKIRISFNSNVDAANQQTDADGGRKSFEVSTWDENGGLKVELERSTPDQNYVSFLVSTYGEGSSLQIFQNGSRNESSGPTEYVTSSATKYTRYETGEREVFSDQFGSSYSANLEIYGKAPDGFGEDGKPNGTWLPEALELFAPFESGGTRSDENGSVVYQESNWVATRWNLMTFDYDIIDKETALVLPTWKLRIFQTGDNESPLNVISFTGDPREVRIECLISECEEDCIPLWDSALRSRICLCEETPGKPSNSIPNLDLESTFF